MDNQSTYWWPLPFVKTIAAEWALTDVIGDVGEETCLLLADWGIWCFAWGIECAPGPNYGRIVIACEAPKLVADNFDECGRYLDGDSSVFA